MLHGGCGEVCGYCIIELLLCALDTFVPCFEILVAPGHIVLHGQLERKRIRFEGTGKIKLFVIFLITHAYSVAYKLAQAAAVALGGGIIVHAVVALFCRKVGTWAVKVH